MRQTEMSQERDVIRRALAVAYASQSAKYWGLPSLQHHVNAPVGYPWVYGR